MLMVAPYEEGTYLGTRNQNAVVNSCPQEANSKLEQETKGTGMTLFPSKSISKGGYAKFFFVIC